MKAYFDNASTTKINAVAMNAMIDVAETYYANPSSLHSMGQKAKEELETARLSIAECIGAAANEIYFTSGGSESDNQAIISAAEIGARKGKLKIITSAFEHHAVLHTLEKLEKKGFEVIYLPVGTSGTLSAKDVENALDDSVALVTIMTANNEIGSVLPIAEIGAVCKQKKILFHTDAVQAVGHIPVNVKDMNVDMLSLSAHKFHGPKGVGVLYARRGIPLTSLIEGGAQERGRRAGTENLPAIVAMAAALRYVTANLDENAAKIAEKRDRIIKELSKIPHSVLNGDKINRLPGNVHFCFEGIEGESLLLLLDQYGIEASSGSACTSGSLDPSHVLLAIGHPHEIAHGSLRITLSEYTTDDEVDLLLKAVPVVVDKLRNMSPVWRDKANGVKPFLLK